MSKDWVKDINEMHDKFGVHSWVDTASPEDLMQFLHFRLRFLDEELTETKNAVQHGDAEEIVDGLIDLAVIAIGTLDAFGADAYDAWDDVLRANMDKRVGVKPTRPNPLGLPDMIKPEGWEGPDHYGRTGLLHTTVEGQELKW